MQRLSTSSAFIGITTGARRLYVTESYSSAWEALSEVITFLHQREGSSAPHGCAVISVDVAMDDAALYYANVVIEGT
jgi:hypothetical protein